MPWDKKEGSSLFNAVCALRSSRMACSRKFSLNPDEEVLVLSFLFIQFKLNPKQGCRQVHPAGFEQTKQKKYNWFLNICLVSHSKKRFRKFSKSIPKSIMNYDVF